MTFLDELKEEALVIERATIMRKKEAEEERRRALEEMEKNKWVEENSLLTESDLDEEKGGNESKQNTNLEGELAEDNDSSNLSEDEDFI